jgi:two-component sensor histidine kinase/TolA-binding protein
MKVNGEYLLINMMSPNFKLVLLLLVFIIIPVSFSFGQTVSKQVSDSLIRVIATEKPDTNKVRDLLKLAYHQMGYLNYLASKKKGLDSVLRIIQQAEVLSNKLQSGEYQRKTQKCYARYDFLSGAFEESRRKSLKLIEYYRRAGDIYQEATTWSEIGENKEWEDTSRATIRLYAYESAYRLFKKGHYRLEAIGAYKNIASVHYDQGKLDLAEKELLQVLDQYHQIGYKTLYFTYNLLASVYHAKKDQEKELKYRLLAIEKMEHTGSVQVRAEIILDVAWSYLQIGRYDKGLYWANRAIALYQQNDHDDFYFFAICAAADMCINSGKYNQALAFLTRAEQDKEKSPTAVLYTNFWFGEYYLALKQYDKAEVYYLRVHEFFQKSEGRAVIKQGNGESDVALANIKVQQRNFGEARKYLDLIGSLPPIKDDMFNSRFELASSKVDSAEGNFASALVHFKKYRRINDSLYNVTKSKQIAELDVQYETREKEQSIKLLNSETRSQKAKLDKINLQRNIILAALALFAIIGVISYRFYRYKQKSNESILKSHKLIESKNKQLELLVQEKEWLLKEVHHRVKNNLHTIICLLESQAAYLENDVLEAMENSQNRIYTMSLIHQKLYQSDDIQTIDMASYIPELVQYLKDSFGTSSKQIYFNLNIEKISLTQAIAIPVALIINEAITNSIKYAFPDKVGGEIRVSLQEEDESIKLELADNGIGMNNDIEDLDSVSLGWQLIKGLSKEIKGDLKIKSESGVGITIIFRKYPWEISEFQTVTS